MTVDTALPVVSICGELLLIVTLIGAKRVRRAPCYFTYICWTLLSDVALLFASSTKPDIYLAAYNVEAVLDTLFQFAVLAEVLVLVLTPLRTALPRVTPWLLFALVVILAAVLWPLAGWAVPRGLSNEAQFTFHLLQLTAILRIVSFLFIAGFSQVLSIGWHDQELQIVTGFGFYAIVSLIVAVLRMHLATGQQFHWLDQVVAFSYLGTLSYWVLSFVQKEKKRNKISPQMETFLLTIGGSLHAERVAVENLHKEGRLGRKR